MIVDIQNCSFIKQNKVLTLNASYTNNRLPKTVTIQGYHNTVEFTAIDSNDPRYDPDGWDGEMQIYRPVTPQSRVEYLVIGYGY